MEKIIQFISSETVITPLLIVSGIVVVILVLIAWIRFIDLRRIYQQDKVFFEATPPREAGKTPEATEQLFHIFHSASATQKIWHRLLRRSNIFSLEVTSTRHDGVRYIIGTSEREADSIERSLGKYLRPLWS